MHDTTRIDLSKYRLEKAEAVLKTAKRLLDDEDYAQANNRAYYSIFHAMRAVIALDEEDYKKHSAVIARFSEKYLKTDVLPREFGKLVSNASRIRNRSDYQDFYICSIDDTRALVTGAEKFLESVKNYLVPIFENADEQFIWRFEPGKDAYILIQTYPSLWFGGLTGGQQSIEMSKSLKLLGLRIIE